MKREFIYLAGSMEHADVDMHGWRDHATTRFSAAEIEVLDPTRRAKTHIEDHEATFNKMHRIVQMDLQDISQCRVVLADMRDSQPGQKLGTMAEITLAQRDRRVVIVLVDEGQWKHPFVYSFATEVHTNLEDAIEACMCYYT